MAATFAARYKKDLSTETLKAKLVHQKSISRKSRHKEFNKGRQFGLIDVNAQASRNGEPPLLEETGEGYLLRSSTKSSQKSSVSAKSHAFPAFLSKSTNIPVLNKPKETVTKGASVEMRLTRSKMKNQLQESVRPLARPPHSVMVPSKDSTLQTDQHNQRQIFVEKPPKERKGAQPTTSTTAAGRVTGATAAALTKISQISRPAVNVGLPLQKSETRNRKQQQRGVKNAKETVLCGMKENHSVEPLKEGVITQIPLDTATELGKDNLPAPIILALAPQRRERSFAPENFVFKPPEGLTTYKVKPMSDVFLSPNLCWSPAKDHQQSPWRRCSGSFATGLWA
uniref:disks large-associated protein 5-like n=1 Tax=Podarcis muralis TaxID=64176 RepID=UPI0010A009FF|nr:disks large-associated protein 5-like [Podarcis muralis]